MGGTNPDGESIPTSLDLSAQRELDKLNLKLWERIEEKLPSDISEADVLSLVSEVFSPDYEIRTNALGRLNRLAAVAARRLVDILVKNTTEATLVFQITYVLEEIGKPAIPPLIESLKKINEFKTPSDLTLIENICQTLIRLNDKSAVPILIEHINHIKQQLNKIGAGNNGKNGTPDNSSKKLYEFYQTVRLRIHDILGDIGAREGLSDLLLLLGDGNKRVHVDVIETIRKIGDQRVLLPLLRLYKVESNISELGARYIKLTFRDIVRREKINIHNHPAWARQELSPDDKETLDKIMPARG